jgi:hypothetical protein
MKLRSKPGLDKRIDDELERDNKQLVWELYKNPEGYAFSNGRDQQNSRFQSTITLRRHDIEEYPSFITEMEMALSIGESKRASIPVVKTTTEEVLQMRVRDPTIMKYVMGLFHIPVQTELFRTLDQWFTLQISHTMDLHLLRAKSTTLVP